MASKAKASEEKKKKTKKISRHKKPLDMTMEEWQVALRKQFGKEQQYLLTNNGSHKVFSDFTVIDPESNTTFRVAIRSLDNRENFCSCKDFRTNNIGTCKHIEWTIHELEHNTYGTKKHFAAPPPERTYSSVYVHYGQTPDIRMRFGEDNKQAYLDLAREYFDATGVLKEEGALNFNSFIQEAKAISPDFRCYEDVLPMVINTRADNDRKSKIEKLEQDTDSLDSLLTDATLFSYQRKGVLFAAKAGRCLLADDMGLGKTIQAIATAELLKKEMGISKTLIICPTSLKYQWKAEIEKFTNSSVMVLEGNPLKRAKLYKTDEHFYMIMTYNIISRDWELINDMDADLVILDEAQRIKNWQTKISRSVKKLNMPYTVVLTGTPLENKLEELYSIVEFINPYKLSPLFTFLSKHQVKEEGGKVIGYKDLHSINKTLRPIMLRRIKKNVIKQMPVRQDKILYVPMTKEQLRVHTEYNEIVAKVISKWKRLGFLPEKDRQKLMIGLNMMRMSCDSTYVIDQQTRHDTKIGELLDILEERLEDPREKVVIFSQWKRMTHIVEEELKELGIGYVHLNGSVPSKHRGGLLDSFREDPDCRVFLSTDAGGVGLNLQTASMVINLDIPWNPAVLEQRIARVYRLGQKRKVQVVNLVSLGTIEHRMLDVLSFKSGLAEGILDDGEDSVFLNEDKFKKFMDSVENITAVPEHQSDEAEEPVEVEIPAVADEEIEEKLPPEAPRPLPKEDDWKREGNKEPKDAPSTGRRRKKGEVAAPKTGGNSTTPEGTPQALVEMGMSFLSGLAQTLSDPKATQDLVNNITETDKETGQSYLKIPVQGKELVENAFKVLGALFQKK